MSRAVWRWDFSRTAAIPASATMRGPSIPAYSAGTTGVPPSQRWIPVAYSIPYSNANGRACACQPVSAGAKRSLAEGDA
jgi:hypothetical protein